MEGDEYEKIPKGRDFLYVHRNYRKLVDLTTVTKLSVRELFLKQKNRHICELSAYFVSSSWDHWGF